MRKFKFEIIRRRSVETRERFLAYFLGNTIEEAEKIYRAFSITLNTISNNYSVVTGLDKADIFGEALTGLARAVRDFNPDRSTNFKGYATFHVKNAINVYVKKNKSIVSIPTYLANANKNLGRVKEGCSKSATFLEKAAKRANISVEALIKRAELIPLDVEYEEQYINKLDEKKEEKMYAALVVGELKKHMTEDELKIAGLIMEGKTYREIGEEFGRGASWVVYKLGKLRKRVGKTII